MTVWDFLELPLAPLILMWDTLTQWWFWAAAVPAVGIALAFTYRQTLRARAAQAAATLRRAVRRAGSNDHGPSHRKDQP